ncbi:hypothetical protein AQ436_01935 [Arthrobacter sp. EpRS66]|nr:hypothetical protein AQ436_01935 [Arthrobacter sp. EpRS66]
MEMVTVPRDALRELSKWAFAASYFDGMISENELVQLAEPIRECIAEVRLRNDERESSDAPWEDFPRGFADV